MKKINGRASVPATPNITFGTDGMRGKVGEQLTIFHAYRLGRYLGQHSKNLVIGKDTRISGDMLSAAFVAGATSVGASVCNLGLVTTPCLVFATVCGKFGYGLMVSASHNPYFDNGLKVIDSNGEKLSGSECKKIEEFMAGEDSLPVCGDSQVGRVLKGKYVKLYEEHLLSCGCSLKGKYVVLDCANGSASKIAPKVFRRLGANVKVLASQPNGININENCGSTHIETLQSVVKKCGADMGFAFDGDADRCIAVDNNGNVVDGDKIIYLAATQLKKERKLKGDMAVATVMSNIGLKLALKKENINLIETNVGDKYVYEAMKNGGYTIGGEQSGHIIFGGLATTGDGILTALKLAEIVVKNKKKLSELACKMQSLPQVLINLPVKDKEKALNNPQIKLLVEKENKGLAGEGRVLVRASGTEPKIRVMVEAKTKEQARGVAEKIAKEITSKDQ